MENGGKAKVIRYLKEGKGFQTIVHIGDGATDLETAPIVDLFIGTFRFSLIYFIYFIY